MPGSFDRHPCRLSHGVAGEREELEQQCRRIGFGLGFNEPNEVADDSVIGGIVQRFGPGTLRRSCNSWFRSLAGIEPVFRQAMGERSDPGCVVAP